MADPKMFDALRNELDGEFVKRTREIEAMILAFVARSHLFLLGTPGTGKSALIERAKTRIAGMRTFDVTLDRFMDDTAVFGLLSLAGMKDDKRVRIPGQWMQNADVAFVDEIWKASGSLSEALLDITGPSRKFVENGEVKRAPLASMLCASNELPDSGLAANWDRIHLRMVVPELTEAGDLRALFATEWDPNPPACLAWDDVLAAQAEAATIPVSPEADDAIIEITAKLAREGIAVSSRRLQDARRIGKASAWLAGDTKVEAGHLLFMQHMLWQTEDQIALVERTVLEVAAPKFGEVLDVRDQLGVLLAEATEATKLDGGDPKRIAVGSELLGKLNRVAYDYVRLEAEVGSAASSALADLERRIEAFNAKILVELLEYGEDLVVPAIPRARNGDLGGGRPRR